MKEKFAILYYDSYTRSKEEVREAFDGVKAILGEDTEIIALPKDFDILLDCSIDQLLQVEGMICAAIDQKQDAILSQPTDGILH